MAQRASIGEVMFLEREVATKKWTEYRGVYSNTNSKVKALHLFVAGQGPIDIDEVQLKPADPADVEIAREMAGYVRHGSPD